MIKNILFFLLLFTISNNYGTAFATSLMMMNNLTKTKRPCTGQVAKEKQPLFIKAEQNEQNFINAKTICLEQNDCDTNALFQQIKQEIENTIIELINHLKELEAKNDGICYKCEKTETKDLKDRLTNLLTMTSPTTS